jgi:hypothetical protein
VSQIDVTELLSDPDFVDTVLLINRAPQVNTAGENFLNEDPIETVGAVQPADGKTVMRLPDDLRVANLMSFWIQGSIVTSAPGKYSSILVFKGRRFEVQHVFDWTAAGAGWSEGLCIAELAAP